MWDKAADPSGYLERDKAFVVQTLCRRLYPQVQLEYQTE